MKTKLFFSVTVIVFLSVFTTASAYQFTFTPRASTTLEYTDNLFLSDQNEEEDLITVVSVGFTLSLLEKNMGLEIDYDPAYVFYNEFDENDGWRHNARFFAWSDLGKNTRLEFTDRFLLTEDPLGEDDLIRDDQVVIPGDTTVRTNRTEYYTNTAIARLNHQFGPDNLIYAEFLHSFLRNDDPGIEDNERYEPSVGLNYWFGQKYGLETRGVYTRGTYSQDSDFRGAPTDDFDNWAGSLRLIRLMDRNFSVYARYDHAYRDYDGDGEFNTDYNLYAPSAGLQYSFQKDLHLSLGLGYFYQDFDKDDSEEGLYGSGEIRKTWNYRRGLIALIGSAGLDQNDFGAQRLGLERFVSVKADAQYNFTRNLDGNIFGNFHYSDPVNTDESGGIEDQKRYGGGAGITYFPLRWMALNLNYQYTKYDADINGINNSSFGTEDEYDENRVIFMITLQPDQPWKYSGI
jgi:opacity protein-like surface antigen